MGALIELPPGHEDTRMQEMSIPLEGVTGETLSLTSNGRPSGLGFLLYENSESDADQQTATEFEAIVAAATDLWGSAQMWSKTEAPRRRKHPVAPALLASGGLVASSTRSTTTDASSMAPSGTYRTRLSSIRHRSA